MMDNLQLSFLCTQLAHSLFNQIKVGFHEFDNADLGRPDAWCDACNEQLKSVKTDKEQEEWFLNKWMPMHLTFPNLE